MSDLIKDLLAYKGVHALCQLNKSTKKLRATHYAMVLMYGRFPIWAVYSAKGNFQAYHGSRASIEEAYPKHVWRRHMATWGLKDIEDKSIERRRNEIEARHGRIPTNR